MFVPVFVSFVFQTIFETIAIRKSVKNQYNNITQCNSINENIKFERCGC